MRSRRHALLYWLVICASYFKGNKVFGKFGSVKVFLDSADIPVDNVWGRSWPEGIKMDDSFNSAVAKVGTLRDGIFPPVTQYIPRKIAPVRRTYNWQAEELIISFNMTKSANPSCTRLEPPITWLTVSGARVKKSQQGIDCGDNGESDSRLKESCSSNIEVSVSRNFAESSLSTLRNKGFSREDIYRMLDKGPWVLAFDISNALPRLFTSLQSDLGFSQSQAVHVVSHCPFLIAQYARYKGRDVFSTAKALLDVGYTMPRLIIDVMRFPSMLAAPPDRIRGWMSLLGGFGIAQDPVLFGKMLRRAPFMLYANPPKIGDEDLSDIENNDVSTTASGFFAYESLKVLQLLRSQDFPDMDKIVRAQPSILLADSSEISARLRFLSDIFLESMSLPSASTGVPTPRFDSSKTISGRNTVWYSSDADLSGEGNKFGGTLDPGMESECENIGMDINKDISYAVELNRMISPLDSIIHDERGVDVPIIAGIKCDRVITTTQHISSADSEIKVEPIVNNIDIQYTPLSDETETESKIANSKALAENVGALSHKDTAQDMLGALLFAYPAVLSIEHRQMRAVGNALRTAGLRRGEVLLIARRHPPVLGRDPVLLINLVSYLRYNCGLRKADLLPFLYRYPAVLGADIRDIELKVEYLFQSLGGSQEMLRRYPSFLSFDLEEHIRPRAEFLRALKIDPLINGLTFLVNAPAKDIAHTAGVRVELFNQYQTAYLDMWKKKTLQDKSITKDAASASIKESKRKATQMQSWISEDCSPEESLLDELDRSF